MCNSRSQGGLITTGFTSHGMKGVHGGPCGGPSGMCHTGLNATCVSRWQHEGVAAAECSLQQASGMVSSARLEVLLVGTQPHKCIAGWRLHPAVCFQQLEMVSSAHLEVLLVGVLRPQTHALAGWRLCQVHSVQGEGGACSWQRERERELRSGWPRGPECLACGLRKGE
jgi:hypothetical protein